MNATTPHLRLAFPLLMLACASEMHAAPVYTASSSVIAGTFSPDISANDLVNTGSLTLTAASLLPAFDTNWNATHLTDGFTSTASNNGATNGNCFLNAAILAGANNVAVYDLNTALSPAGYQIDSVQSVAGFPTWNTMQANQKYEIWTRSVGAPNYILKATVDYSPFTDPNSGPGETKMLVTDSSGPLATAVESIRFVFLPALQNGGIAPGTVYREIDVSGVAMPSGPLAVASPRSRQIIQRDSYGVGSVPVTGSFSGTPEYIEARAVVMSGGANNGTDTDWQIVDGAPAGGVFSGVLPDVNQGGWYQIEVRAYTNGVPGTPVIVQRVGIGDIYVTAGQSNSASWGSPAAAAVDDRVSALHSGSGVWSAASDPMPYADGTGGSPWTRLGDLLAAQQNVPIGFACIGVGSTSVAQWNPVGGAQYARFTAALSRFPAHGFKAILWHQGEFDSIAGTSRAAMISGLQAIIAQTRADDGWTIPWYVSEASYIDSGSNLATEEPIAAAQRMVSAADPLVFRGSATDDFHLSGKLSDNVHFNSAGLLDHAQQWRRILTGTSAIQISNPSFDQNGALADGGIFFVSTTNTQSPRPIGWRVLDATGAAAAASPAAAGYFNPNSSFYANSNDSVNGGQLPGMTEKHCGFLYSGVAGIHFLQTLEATLQPATRYQLTVALGIRTAASTFGGARVELLADGQVLKGLAIPDKPSLDAYRGSDSSGSFTDVTFTFDSPVNVAAGQSLGIRLVKIGATDTYADFDNVRLVASPIPPEAPKSVLIDFSDPGAGVSFGTISPSYQPLLAPLGITIGYQNVGVYNGGPDHTQNDVAGANFNTFQNLPGAGYTEPSVTPQIFTFSAPVTVQSLWLSTFQGGTATINITAYADEGGTVQLGGVQTVTPSGGSNPIVWQQFTGLAAAPYAGQVRRIEFISSEPVGGSSYVSNIQVDDLLVTEGGGLSPYQTWAHGYWTGGTDPNAAADADPDGDTLPNAVEFHMGTSPLVGNAAPKPTAVSHSGRNWMRLSLPLDPAVDHSQFDVLGSPTMVSWTPVASVVDDSVQFTQTPSLWTVDVDRDMRKVYFLRLFVHAGP